MWQPVNEIERDLMAALESGDGQRYAKTLMSAPLYLPVLPQRGSKEWQELHEKIQVEQEHLLVFTSPEALTAVLGRFAPTYRDADYASLARLVPEPSFPLAVNPGLPIGAVLPVQTISDLAEGRESLVSAEDAEDRIRVQIRQACLAELGSGGELDEAPEPVNELEAELYEALERQDSDGFLQALINAEVVVPTNVPVRDPARLDDMDFPWRVVGDDLPVIMLFSSAEMMDRVAKGDQHRITGPFVSALANWPDEEYALCLNPGAATELIMDGGTVFDLIAALFKDLPEVADAE